jgi:hypothetical protein
MRLTARQPLRGPRGPGYLIDEAEPGDLLELAGFMRQFVEARQPFPVFRGEVVAEAGEVARQPGAVEAIPAERRFDDLGKMIAPVVHAADQLRLHRQKLRSIAPREILPRRPDGIDHGKPRPLLPQSPKVVAGRPRDGKVEGFQPLITDEEYGVVPLERGLDGSREF